MRRGIPVRTHWVPLQFFLVAAGFQQYPATVSEGVTVMNVSRSTFVRRDCVLTALIVAVLLAGFSGTAWAQTTTTTTTASSRFTSSSGTLEEGATTSVDTPKPLKVTIRRSTRSKADPYNTSDGSPSETRIRIQRCRRTRPRDPAALFRVAAGPPDETPDQSAP